MGSCMKAAIPAVEGKGPMIPNPGKYGGGLKNVCGGKFRFS